MSIEGPIRTVQNGLIFHLDAGNDKSYPGSGTTWTDISRTGNNGTLTNGPSYTSSFGGGVVFDGTNDFVVGTSNTGISGTGARTLSTWFYPTDMISTQFYSVARIGAGTTFQLFEILIYRENDAYLIFLHIWGGNEVGVGVQKTLLSNYSNIVCSYDGTTVYMYLDGKLMITGNRTLSTANSTFTLGSPAYGAHKYFSGRISNVSLYNRSLSPNEVLQNYDAAKSRFGL
jgi:hypothetical protein